MKSHCKEKRNSGKKIAQYKGEKHSHVKKK